GGDFGLQQFLGAGNALDVVGIGVSGNQHLARGEVVIHLPDQIHNLGDRVQIADVNQQKLAAAVDEIDVDPEPTPGLIIQLDDMRKEVLPLQHDLVHLVSGE